MKFRSVQCILLVLIIASLQRTADGQILNEPRILLLGDSWTRAIQDQGIFDTVLEEQGLGHFSALGETTTLNATTAEDWADPVMFELISTALDAHPTVDSVYILLGINETISGIIDAAGGDLAAYIDPDFQPDTAVLDEALNAHISNLTTIITRIKGEHPEIVIGISSYEYLAGIWTDARLVPWFLELAMRQRQLAETIEGCVFLHHFGILQYTFGLSPFVGPREVPYPGAPPLYLPFPGGDPTLPSPPEGGPSTDNFLTTFHLNAAGYALLVANSMDQLYGARLVGLSAPLCQIATDITDLQFEEYVATFGADTTSGGLPLIASLALLGTASCRLDEAVGRTAGRAFYANKASLDLELAAPELQEFAEVLSALLLIDSRTQAEVSDVLSAAGIVLANEYRVVFCESDVDCAEAAFAQIVLGGSAGGVPAGAQEPFSGNGDIDADGVTNLEEYEAVIARGGSVDRFVAVALDPTRDGTEIFPSVEGGTCFIATAAYGTPLDKRIDVLRRLRDDSMLTTAVGAAFVDTYYRLSPPIAQHLAGNPTARRIVRSLLDEVVTTVEFGRRLANKLTPALSK